MHTQGFAACLKGVLFEGLGVNESFDPDGIARVETYKEARIVTHDAGLVVTMDDGTEFQITIMQTR
jgi:hypothetical protein